MALNCGDGQGNAGTIFTVHQHGFLRCGSWRRALIGDREVVSAERYDAAIVVWVKHGKHTRTTCPAITGAGDSVFVTNARSTPVAQRPLANALSACP